MQRRKGKYTDIPKSLSSFAEKALPEIGFLSPRSDCVKYKGNSWRRRGVRQERESKDLDVRSSLAYETELTKKGRRRTSEKILEREKKRDREELEKKCVNEKEIGE